MSVNTTLMLSTRKLKPIGSRGVVYLDRPTLKKGKMKRLNLQIPREHKNHVTSVLTNQITVH